MKEQKDDITMTLIAKYLGNELTDSEKELFELWLNASPDNRKELEKARTIWSMASTNEAEDFDTESAWNKMNHRIHKQPVELKIGRKSMLIPFIKIAATILLIIGVSFSLRWYYINSKYEQVVAYQKILEPVILPDGTKVFLNSGAKIKYPKVFGSIRKIELTGEAFFNVTRNEKSPFVIQTVNAQIKVLGTSFNVSAYQETDSVQVVVESGTVELASRNSVENIRLTKGNSGVFYSKSKKLVKSTTSDINAYSWKTNIITFKNADLNYVSKTLSKTFSTKISIDNDQLKTYKLNAVYDNLKLEDIFKALKTTHCLDAKKTSEGYLIFGPAC